MKIRSRESMMRDILKVLAKAGPVNKIQLRRKANLQYAHENFCFNTLQAQELIKVEKTINDEGLVLFYQFEITPQGYNYLRGQA